MLHSPRETTTTTTTITYSKLAAAAAAAADLGLVRSSDGWTDIKGGAKKEASHSPVSQAGRQSVSHEGGQAGRQEGSPLHPRRCRRDHFDGHLETIQLCRRLRRERGRSGWGWAGRLSLSGRMKERRKELNWEQVRGGMQSERATDAYFIPCPNVAAAEFDTSIERFLCALPLCLSPSHSGSTLSDCC